MNVQRQDPAFPGYDIMPLSKFSRGGRWRTEAMRSHRRPALIWFTKGQGRITISGVTRGYGPHNAVFLPAGTMYGFDMLGQVFGHLLFFPETPDLGLPADVLHLRVRDARRQAELTAQVEQIQAELDRDRTASNPALPLRAGLLAVWLSRQDDLVEPDQSCRNASTRLASAYASLVERDFRAGKGVADYAADLGVTPTHLSRVCNWVMGRPASDLLADRVLFEARRMLSETRTPVKDVADHLGFASPAYFTRAFHKRTGQTPTAFRRANAG